MAWRSRLLGVLLLLAGPAFGQALPVFSPDGPDAAGYGAAEGYPLGKPGPDMDRQRNLVGSYSHYDTILAARMVPRAASPSPLARAAREIALSYPHQGRSQTIASYLDRQPATGLLIARDRTILLERYRYGRTDAHRLTSQSMAKTITAMLVGIAIAEGPIASVDDAASLYVPELAGRELGRTPIRALLHMASGLAYSETYDGTDDASKLNRELWRPDTPGPAAALAQFNTRAAEPDTRWYYAGMNTELLGLILTRATRMPLADYFATRIWRKIGAEADASWVIDASGQEAAFCCVSAVLRDWGRLGMLLANDGAWDGVQVIPRQWLLDATTAMPAGHFLAPGTMTRFYGYGYQVWLLPGGRRQFALLGIHGQTLLVDPGSKLVLVHTAVRVRATGDPMAAELISLWNALVAQEGMAP